MKHGFLIALEKNTNLSVEKQFTSQMTLHIPEKMRITKYYKMFILQNISIWERESQLKDECEIKCNICQDK